MQVCRIGSKGTRRHPPPKDTSQDVHDNTQELKKNGEMINLADQRKRNGPIAHGQTLLLNFSGPTSHPCTKDTCLILLLIQTEGHHGELHRTSTQGCLGANVESERQHRLRGQ